MSLTKLGACVRCFTSTPAATIERITFGAGSYDLPLCESHADMLQRDMFGWARCGTLVDDTRSTFAPLRERRRGTVEVAHVHFPVIREHELLEVVPAPRPKPAQVVDYDELGLPVGWNDWTFSDHATDRRESRGISPIEAMWCAQAPDVVRPGRSPSTLVHIKGHVQVVVNPDERTIVTVINRNIKSDQDMELTYAAS